MPDFEIEPFLTYHFQGFKFEFIKDELFITNTITKYRYKIQFEHYKDIPFLITLVEKN